MILYRGFILIRQSNWQLHNKTTINQPIFAITMWMRCIRKLRRERYSSHTEISWLPLSSKNRCLRSPEIRSIFHSPTHSQPHKQTHTHYLCMQFQLAFKVCWLKCSYPLSWQLPNLPCLSGNVYCLFCFSYNSYIISSSSWSAFFRYVLGF